MISDIHLLIVDDDPVFAEVIGRSLQKRGFSVDIATCTAEALQAVNKQTYQRVLLDLKIGEESGLTLLSELLMIQPRLCIVMLTGYSSISTAVHAIKNGAHNYLCKPVNTDDVLAAFEAKAAPQTPELPAQPLSVERLAWEHIQKVLQEHKGNISATARSLGMHRRTLQRRLAKKPVKQ